MLIGSSTSFVGESQIGSDDSNSQTVSPGVGGLTLAGFAALIFVNVIVAPGVGNLSAQGFAPIVTASDHQTVVPGVGSLAVTGFAPTVTASDSQTVSPDVGSLVLAGFAPSVSASDNQTVAAGLGEIVLSGFAPAVSATDQQTVAPDVGSLILSGFEPSIAVNDNQNVASGLGALSLTGFAPSVSASDNQTVLPGTGQFAAAGFSPTITSAFNQVVTPGTGALVLTGYAPTVAVSISLALHVDSTGGPRYRVRSSGSPSYQIDSTGGNRYRVVRGHEITSALEVSDPNVIPYDSLSLHPGAWFSDDFNYPDTATWLAALQALPTYDVDNTNDQLAFATIDAAVQYAGHNTLKLEKNGLFNPDIWLKKPVPTTEMWVRYGMKSSVGETTLLGSVYVVSPDYDLDSTINYDFSLGQWVTFDDNPDVTILTESVAAGASKNVVQRYAITSPTTVLVQTWIDGVKGADHIQDIAITGIQWIELEVPFWDTALPQHLLFVESVDGVTYPNPYSGLGA